MLNKTILIGRLTWDPELKETQSGTSVCNFSIAVNRRYKNAEGGYDADFINCVAWRQTGEFVSRYFSKGRMIAVVGSLQTRNYEKDGQRHYVTEVQVDEAYFGGDKADINPGNQKPEAFAPETDEEFFASAADLPF